MTVTDPYLKRSHIDPWPPRPDTEKLLAMDKLPLQQFVVEREGWKWRIIVVGSDGIERPLHPIAGRFWRWITAARIAGTLTAAHNDGAWLGLDSPWGPGR